MIVQNMMLRPFQGFLFKPLNIRFDQRHRLGDILIQGGHGNLLPTLLPKGVGRGTGLIADQEHGSLGIRHPFHTKLYVPVLLQIFPQQSKDLGGNLVAVNSFITVLAVIFQVGEHRVPCKRPQVHNHLLLAAGDRSRSK